MIPKLRFPEFDGGWEHKPLKSLLTSLDSGWSPICKSEQAKLDEWGSLKTTSISWNGFNPNENKKLPNSLQPKHKCEVQYGDVLVTRVGPLGRVGVVCHVNTLRTKLMASDNMFVAKLKEDFEPKFAPHLLGSYSVQKSWNRKISGLASAQVVINKKTIYSTWLYIPSLEEQKKIALFIGVLDQKINLLTKKKEALETYKKGLMQKIFSQELRFKREDGTDYPEWLKCSLGDVGDLKNGYAFKSDSYIEEGDYSIVTIKNVQNGKLINGFNCISELPKNIKKHHLLQIDDLLISMTGNVGRVCLVKQTNLLLNQRVGLIAIIDEMDKKLCFYQLQQNSMLNYFIKNGEGAAQPNISKDVILNAQLRIPTDKEEKIKIVHFFSMIDNLIDNVQESLESAVKLKSGLLQQMFV